MDKEKIRERLNEFRAILSEKQAEVGRIEDQQRIINEKFTALEAEKLALSNSFKKLMGELAELGKELKILEEKILHQN